MVFIGDFIDPERYSTTATFAACQWRPGHMTQSEPVCPEVSIAIACSPLVPRVYSVRFSGSLSMKLSGGLNGVQQ